MHPQYTVMPSSFPHDLNPADHAWQSLEIPESLKLLESNPNQGLDPAQVRDRLQRFGPNELEESAGRSSFEIFIDQFKNIMLLMLIAVALISGFLDVRSSLASGVFVFPKDAVAIFAVVLLNGILGYVQESGAEKALAALKNLSSANVRVIRDGKTTEVTSKEIVPGDIMLVEAGVRLAADGRLLEAASLQIREAALTGEALAVNKQSDQVLPADTELGDRINLVFTGTEVVQGRGTVLVTGTGMKTELGKIASNLQSVEAEPTPLQRRMTQLGNSLVAGSLILVAIVIIGGTLYDAKLLEKLVEVSLSMAVAVVPEGLPAVITVTLALGTQRMVKRNALIRKLQAVETLGSVTTICSDKTGTLTQNKMVVQSLYTAQQQVRVTGEGYAPKGEFLTLDTQQVLTPSQSPELQTLLLACVVCNDAILQLSEGDWVILGDPTEGALLAAAGKAGLEQDQQASFFPRLGEIPFTSERKRMSVVVDDVTTASGIDLTGLKTAGDNAVLFSKGSPELVLERCQTILVQNQPQALSETLRSQILDQNNALAGRGLRVLGFAARSVAIPSGTGVEESMESQLVWLGLVAMLDAPRPEVRQAVAQCKRAGIRPVMITGDHQLTAQAIAEELGMTSPGDRVLTGRELEKMSQAELEQQVKQVGVYARVSPEHKLRIVQALQKQGQVVAMTGDGVNDAPALKQADIGVAMGITGTDVSKEASDMVLLDDNFATIVAATEEGRVVYTNIRRFIRYILGSNIGEVITIAMAPLLGLGDVPLTPLQILWMNLVTDGLPALALAVEPGRASVMQQPPKDPQESIFARGLGSYMIRIGLILAITTVAMMIWAYRYTEQVQGNGLDRDRWQTMVFTTLCLAQMGHAIAIRSNTRLALEVNQFSNPFILASVTLTSLLQILLIYVPVFQDFFGTHYLPLDELMVCIGFSSLVFVWIELEKLYTRWFLKSKVSTIS